MRGQMPTSYELISQKLLIYNRFIGLKVENINFIL